MKTKILAGAFFALATILVVGCGSDEATSVATGADQSAVEEYEALLEADQKAMEGAGIEDE